MRARGRFLLCVILIFGVCSLEWAAVKKPKTFVLGFNAGLGHWTSQISRDVRIYALPSFPPGHAAGVADTDTDVNYHLGFSFTYDFTPKFGLQAEISRINAEYLILIGLNPSRGQNLPRYDTLDLPWRITTVYINGVFRFQKTKKKVAPFAFFGAGFNICNNNRATGEYVEIESESSVDLGLKMGGGLDYTPSGADIGFELRAFILYLTAVGAPSYSFQSYTNPSPGFSGENLVWAFDLGMKYRF